MVINPSAERAAPHSQVIEDYAKAIYKLERAGEAGEAVSNSALAEALGVSPGAITGMLKRLEELELIAYEPYKGASLTPAGERVALEVMRHHRLLEAYLAEVLGMPWDRVHEEAEVLEHYISEELEELIAKALGDPERDPHGAPIPSRELVLAEDSRTTLADCEPGATGRLLRVSDSDPEMLRYLAGRGIAPGDRFEVVERQPFGGPLTVRFGDAATGHALGGDLVEAMRVEVDR
ncbi:MAG: metal-dependent transcriptional regulator [Solirubrobacterales bacterium]|nr:metal-dependent transcriptional regulator [Solirubrobacterales bacterium]